MNGAKLFISAILLALATGCSSKTATIVLADDPNTAKGQIQNLIPQGTTATNAEQIMRKQGFDCSIIHGGFLDGDNMVSNADFIYCDKRVGSMVQRRYQVALVLTNNQVSAVKLSTGLIGP